MAIKNQLNFQKNMNFTAKNIAVASFQFGGKKIAFLQFFCFFKKMKHAILRVFLLKKMIIIFFVNHCRKYNIFKNVANAKKI